MSLSLLSSCGSALSAGWSLFAPGPGSNTDVYLSGQNAETLQVGSDTPWREKDVYDWIINPTGEDFAGPKLYFTSSPDATATQSTAATKAHDVPPPRPPSPRLITYTSNAQTDCMPEELLNIEDGRVWRRWDQTNSGGASGSRADHDESEQSSGQSDGTRSGPRFSSAGAGLGGIGAAAYLGQKMRSAYSSACSSYNAAKDSLLKRVDTLQDEVLVTRDIAIGVGLGVLATGAVATGLSMWALTDGVRRRAWEEVERTWDSYASGE